MKFFFNDTATTEIYTLSLHDALPISSEPDAPVRGERTRLPRAGPRSPGLPVRRARRRCADRKSTRLNSSHSQISYAVFCLKKKTLSIEPFQRSRQPLRRARSSDRGLT